jgi:hypothetical protein
LISHVFACGMSRSGTTLLTTILDSHPDVSMGYELLPAGLDDAASAAEKILAAGEEARACSAALEASGEHDLSVLVHRADRSLVSPVELAGILRSFAEEGRGDLSSFEGRIAVSKAIAEAKARQEGTSITGFKVNSPRVGLFDQAVGDGAVYVYILRDPRDVWRSHVQRGFDRTLEQTMAAWGDYLRRFENFARRNPDRAFLVRYEDLVQSPKETLDAMCETIGLSRDPAMDRFYESKASVLRGGHANSEELSQDFFTTSIGRWDGLSEEDLRAIESRCHDGMAAHGYEKVTDAGFRFPEPEWKRNRERLEKKRLYYLNEYADLVLPAVKTYPHRTWLEATTAPAGDRPEEILVIRHDIDHDIENAVTMARWEADHGIRTTYCVLHTAWYYARTSAGRVTARSEEMVEACLEIQAMGHEINLHNNLIVTALRTGADPYDLLAEELDFLRSRGLDVRGTSTHGDSLCGELGVQNMELFSETVYPSRGGARTIRHEGHEITIGTRSMEEFGLAYEGYDLPRDVYVTDSGGRLRVEADTPGRAGLRRHEMDPPPAYRKVVGILTHPVWWDLSEDAPTRREELGFQALARSVESRPSRRLLRDFLRR